MIQFCWKEVRDMMTIKEFARLCSCNAQTLRYYDKIDLLKPVKVDQWSGYRYYAPTQAIDFVKIKNLQAADFTIDEIKALLTKPDQQVYKAFDRKIAEQTQKLERIREIQQSYLTEKNMIEQIVQSVSDYVLSSCTDLEVLREFGLSSDDAPEVLARLRSYLNQWIAPNADPDCGWDDITLVVNEEVFHGEKAVMDRLRTLAEEKPSNTVMLGDTTITQDGDFDFSQHVTLWSRHGWEHVYDFINEIPPLEPGQQYCCLIHSKDDRYKGNLSFGTFLLGAILLKRDVADIPISVVSERSGDSENHFALLRRK